jgi:hypothetical protein
MAYVTIISARFSERPLFHQKTTDASPLFLKHGDALKKAYADIDDKVSKVRAEARAAHLRRVKAFNTKTCFCGGILIFREDYGFWGCNIYRTPGEHFTAHGRNPQFSCHQPVPSVNWLTDILIECGLKGKVTTKQLFQFFLDEGLPDLRVVYGTTKSDNMINGLQKANERSKIQEAEVLKMLKEKYPRVAYQQCITYQLDGATESFCIPDFICGSDDKVMVVDAKLDYPNDEQMDLYVQLVRFILKQSGDRRPVFGSYAMYDRYAKSKYPIMIIPKPVDSS